MIVSTPTRIILIEADAHLALAMAALEGMGDESPRDLRKAHEIHQLLHKARTKMKGRI